MKKVLFLLLSCFFISTSGLFAQSLPPAISANACSTINTAINDTLCSPGVGKFFSITGNDIVTLNTNDEVTSTSDTLRVNALTTTSIQVSEVTVGSLKGNVGPLTGIAATGFGNFSNGQFISVLDTLRIDSMSVRANGVVTANVQVFTDDPANGGVLLQTGESFTTGAAADATYKIAVGTVLTPGTYFINVDFTGGAGQLFRATGGAAYPYTLAGLLSIDSTNFSSQSRIYYTFDIVVNEVCISAKKTVTAEVIGNNPGVGKSEVLCDNAAALDLTSVLSAGAASGGTFVSATAAVAITGTMLDPSLLTPGIYELYYRTSGTSTCPADSSQFTFYIQNCSGCATLVAPTGVNDTICGPDFFTLNATGSNLVWYNPIDSVLIGGNSFVDSVDVTTAYNVRSVFSAGPALKVGPSVTTNSNVYPTGNFTNGQYITVSKTVRIDSATFAVNGPLDFVVAIQDMQKTDTLQVSQIINFTASDTAAKEIGIVLTPGNYFMSTIPLNGTGILYRMAAGGDFPYGIPGFFTADSSDFGPTRYYYLNDMQVSSACISPSTTVTAVVSQPFDAGTDAADTICDTLMVDLSNYLGTFDPGGTFVDVGATGALSGSMFNAYAVAKNATYTFRYEGGVANCKDTATISIFVDYCSIGLKETMTDGLMVYPNPTSGSVFVENGHKNSGSVKVEVYAINGQLVYNKTFDGKQLVEIELRHLPDGIYNIRVASDNGSSIQRIVKQ